MYCNFYEPCPSKLTTRKSKAASGFDNSCPPTKAYMKLKILLCNISQALWLLKSLKVLRIKQCHEGVYGHLSLLL